MRNFYFYKKKSIYSSFIGLIVLQFICTYTLIWYLQPAWSMMSLIYWIVATPKQVNIGTGFFLGLIVDCIFSSILGVHALSFSIISYLTICKVHVFRNFFILKQSLLIIFFSSIDQSCKLLINFLVTKTFNSPCIYWNCILNGIIWPLLLYSMHRIYTR